MSNEKSNQSAAENKSTDRAPYKPPAIIYEGLITTRAGSPTDSKSPAADSGANPADIFSTGS